MAARRDELEGELGATALRAISRRDGWMLYWLVLLVALLATLVVVALTLIRAGVGTLLLGGLCAGATIWHGTAAWSMWGIALVGATLCDWLDGPLARRLGTTKLGAALDIEADSWLTLWCGVAAIIWGGLPWWIAVPPLLHYLVPLRALWRGGVPSSEGPWWGRVTGTAQMAIFFAVLLPLGDGVGFLPRGMLDALAPPVALAQGVATLAPLLARRR